MPFCGIRVFLTVFVMGAGLLVSNIPAVFAQESPGGEAAALAADPITEAERALTLDVTRPAAAGSAPSSTGALVRMVLTLALAAAAIYGVIYFIKRAGRRAEVRDPFLKVLASTPLGNNRYAHVVAVGSKAWLLGAADSGVNLIAEIGDKDILNAMFLEDSRKSAETPVGGILGRVLDFKTMLRRMGMPAQDGAPGADTIRKRRERLKGL